MKTLKTKRVNAVVCWTGLKHTAPKDFPSVVEIEKTVKIIDLFKEAAGEFGKTVEEGEKLNNDIQIGKIEMKDIVDKKAEFQKRVSILEDRDGDKIVEIEFEDDLFNTFFQQFGRWGKNWFFKLEAFVEFNQDLNSTNQQPKKGK